MRGQSLTLEQVKAAADRAEGKAPAKSEIGRPSSYQSGFADQARKLCELGATDVDIADFFEVDIRTIYRWKHDFPEFCHAIKIGKNASDERVERSLYHKAVGYTFDAVKVMQNNGEPVYAPYREHVPPDTTACIFWLKNRRPKDWRDRHELTGADGGPITIAPDLDLARWIAEKLAAGEAKLIEGEVIETEARE